MTNAESKYMTMQQVTAELTEALGFSPHQIKTAVRAGKLRAVPTEYAIEREAVEDFKRDFVKLNGEGKLIIRRRRRKAGRK